MAWKATEVQKTVDLTRALVDKYVNMAAAPGDKPLSEHRVDFYDRLLDEGKLRSPNWACAFCKETGTLIRLNGKHTSIMLSRRKPLPAMKVVIEQFECDTLLDVAELYSTYDSVQQIRKSRDINMAYAASIPELANVRHQSINIAVSAIAYHTWGEGYAVVTMPPDRSQKLAENIPFVRWLDSLIAPNQGQHLRRAAVAAVLYATYIKHRNKAMEFWLMVRDESGTSNDTPDRRLASFLIRTTVNEGAGAHRTQVHRYKLANREFYYKSVVCWNSWFSGATSIEPLRYGSHFNIPEIL